MLSPIAFRPLGTLEHALWLRDQVAPLHFAVTAQISGKFKVAQLITALEWAQQRHPLLRMRVLPSTSAHPWFVEAMEPIPLRVMHRQGDAHWQREVSEEIACPFDPTTAPLLRTVLLHGAETSELIVTCHPTIGDGFSVAHLLQDLVQMMNVEGPQTQPLPKRLPVEDRIFGNVVAIAPNQGFQPSPDASKDYSSKTQYVRPLVLSWSFSSAQTHHLFLRCRQEQTTVHAAVAAAFMQAIAQASPLNPLSCLLPVNLRSSFRLPLADEMGCYIELGCLTETVHPHQDLWGLARSLKAQLNHTTSLEQLVHTIPQRQSALAAQLEAEPLRQTCDLMVTNLGPLNGQPTRLNPQSPLHLQAIYGPALLSGQVQERVVGVATLGDRTFFTLTWHSKTRPASDAIQLQQTAMLNLEAALNRAIAA